MNVWQVAVGDSGRDYRKLFFDHDLMIIGPGDLGDARSDQYANSVTDLRDDSRRVRRFAEKVACGDRVLMRHGQEVIGVGEIPPEAENQYEFDYTFRSVYGWDLRHRRRVKWAAKDKLLDRDLDNSFKGGRMSRFSQVHNSEALAAVRSLDTVHFAAPLNALPSVDTRPYKDDELRADLLREGVNEENIEGILSALRRAKHLLCWYRRTDEAGRTPTEHEVVSHILLPLFLGLGWSYQQIAVEWNKVDMAFFERTPTIEANCVMVLEAKGLERGLSQVLDQPRNYVRTLELKNARYIVTTNGATLFVYGRNDAEWKRDPIGYLSIPNLQREYVLPKCTSPIDTLMRLRSDTDWN